MKARLDYAAAGGNRHPSAADWAPGLLAFGAGNNLAIWNPQDTRQNGISALLAGHSDVVNAVKILDLPSKRLIISGSADHTVRIWAETVDQAYPYYEQVQSLEHHTGSVNTIACLNDQTTISTGAADGTVSIWQIQSAGLVEHVQTLPLKPRYLPLTTAITSLSDGAVVLAVAGTSSYIQLYVRAGQGAQFELQATLIGHEGWIRSLDFVKVTGESDSDLLLASASQDKYVRLWRFRLKETSLGAANDSSTGLSAAGVKKSLSNKAHEVGSPETKFAVTFEALLIGHEDWIYTAKWAARKVFSSSPTLLSASADNSLALWTSDEASGVWVCNARLGEISAQKGSTTATGSAGGFWIGLWQPDGQSVVSLGRTGSWRRWSYDTQRDMWVQQVGISGHVQEVQSLAWAHDGSYLLTTGSDQTTRLFAEWSRDGHRSWHEFARPQIHGYDLNCIDTLTSNQFVSGADEKLLRVFNKPKAIDNLLSTLTGVAGTVSGELADAANIPVLGLSNKAVTAVADDEPTNGIANGDDDERDAVDPASVVHKSTLDLDHPPFEDHLARHTLWPEHEKLYGHGYEISAVSASHDHALVATACKASSIDHAVIRMYETKEWREIKPPLTAHGLTVARLAFSGDDRYLLSVGRDRQWALFERDAAKSLTYKPLTSNPKGHSRMILDCAWAPTDIGYVFATAGRDKLVKIWRIAEGKAECAAFLTATSSVTAVAFTNGARAAGLVLAFGVEDGQISLAAVNTTTLELSKSTTLHRSLCASKAINALRWTPGVDHGQQLAVASDDAAVRILGLVDAGLAWPNDAT